MGNPGFSDPALSCRGNDRPNEVIEIGGSSILQGMIKEVKPLGLLPVISQTILTGKIIAMNVGPGLSAKRVKKRPFSERLGKNFLTGFLNDECI